MHWIISCELIWIGLCILGGYGLRILLERTFGLLARIDVMKEDEGHPSYMNDSLETIHVFDTCMQCNTVPYHNGVMNVL